MGTTHKMAYSQETGCYYATYEDGRKLTVRFSARQNSWYIEDAAGEPASGLYDTEEDALGALDRGEF